MRVFVGFVISYPYDIHVQREIFRAVYDPNQGIENHDVGRCRHFSQNSAGSVLVDD